MTTKLTTFKSVSSHVEDLASGRTIAPGELVDLSTDDINDPHNERLIIEGVLIMAQAEDSNDKSKEGGKA